MRARWRWALVCCLLFYASLALAAGVQVWPKLDGVPNFYIGLPDSQNGQHPIDRESYGEGWFWMGRFDDGSASFINFMVSNIGPGDNKGTVDVTVWEPSGQTHLARVAFTKGSFSAATDKLDVRVGENRIWGSHPNFRVKVVEKGIAIDLKYEAQLPGFALNSGRVTYGDPDDFYSVYTTVPRAKITGTITTPSGTRQVGGYGYSDHGVVTMLPHEYSRRWYTLRAANDKYTLDFLEFTVPEKWGGTRVPLAIFGADGKILYGGSRYTLTPSDIATESKYGVRYPKKFTFAIDRPGKIKVEGTYTFTKPMHTIDVLSQLNAIERMIAKFFAKSYVMRYQVQVDATVTLPDGTTDHFQAPGIAEVVDIQ